APYFDKDGLRKGAWSQEEDDKLRAYVQNHGHCSWSELPKCGKSCRLRWMNYLRPDVKHGNYSKEEEDIILNLHEQHGNKWSMIAAKLPGRSDNEVKNYWHTHLKKRISQTRNSCKLKEKSCETSESEVSLERDNLAKHFTACNPPNPILESNPLSPEISSTEFSCSVSDSAAAGAMSGANLVAEGSDLPLGTIEESLGDFWTEPFWTEPLVADNAYDNQGGYSSCFLEEDFMSPYDNLRGAWSPEEDDKLRAYILRYGHWNWRQLPRSVKVWQELQIKMAELSQARCEAWKFFQRGRGFDHSTPQWSKIASKLPGRTDNEVKNHWHTYLNKKKSSTKPKEKKSSTLEKEQQCTNRFSQFVILDQVQSKDLEIDHQSRSSQQNPSHDRQLLQEDLTSPQETSNDTTSNFSANDSMMSRTNSCSAEDGFTSSEEEIIFQSLDGDFWTEPFVADSMYNQLGDCTSSLLDRGSYTSLYGLNFDDDMDWIQEVIQELQDN
ncbi:hypothetical protein Tsubulata_011615, partial [Turnera subulata]